MDKPSRPVFDVKVKVIYQKGHCVSGHKVGDEWIVGTETPGGICNAAYATLFPHIRVFQRDGQYAYPKGSEVARFACPDAWNPIIFELSKVPGTIREAKSAPPGSGEMENLPYK